MKLIASFPGLFALIGFVLADGASIMAAVAEIASDAAAVDTALSSWNGSPLETLPLLAKTAALVVSVDQATDVAKASAVLTEAEAFEVAISTGDMITGTLKTLDTITAARPKFDHLLLRPVIYVGLKTQKVSITKLSDAVVEKLPALFQPVAEELINELMVKYDAVIDYYKLF
jgi:hypothetical protein